MFNKESLGHKQMSKIKLSDFIAKYLKERYNVTHFFMVSGGGAMHLNDSLGRYINYTANHHEQACAIAAEGYSRFKRCQCDNRSWRT